MNILDEVPEKRSVGSRAATSEFGTGVVPVEFRTPAGKVLRGQAWGEGERWAVLVHEEGFDLDIWRELSRDLVGIGLRVLAFDLGGHGASDDPWQVARLPDDVTAALAFSRHEGAEKLYLVGAGAAADACLQVAASERVDAVVAISPLGNEDARTLASVRHVNMPRLIIVGSAEPASLDAAEGLYRAAVGWCLLVGLPTEDEGNRLLAGELGDAVRDRISGFLRDYL